MKIFSLLYSYCTLQTRPGEWFLAAGKIYLHLKRDRNSSMVLRSDGTLLKINDENHQ